MTLTQAIKPLEDALENLSKLQEAVALAVDTLEYPSGTLASEELQDLVVEECLERLWMVENEA